MRITTEKESPVVLTPASPKISTAPDIITMEKMLAENHINLLLRAYSSVCEALDISLP